MGWRTRAALARESSSNSIKLWPRFRKRWKQPKISAGAAVEHAIIGVGGSNIKGVNSHGGISLGTRPREIGRDEIKQAVERARAIPLPQDREILHLLPQEFILDDQAGVHDPLGMMAARLEVRVHMGPLLPAPRKT